MMEMASKILCEEFESEKLTIVKCNEVEQMFDDRVPHPQHWLV